MHVGLDRSARSGSGTAADSRRTPADADALSTSSICGASMTILVAFPAAILMVLESIVMLLPLLSVISSVPPSSSSTILWPLLVFRTFLRGLRRFGNGAARVPGAGPDRIAEIAALEFDPDAGADIGHREEALLARAAIGKGGQRPAGLFIAQQRAAPWP